MELSILLDYLLKQRGTDRPRRMEEAAVLCRDAGFSFVDYTPDFQHEDWEARARHDREVLDAAGITVEQTHAPFNRYDTHPAALFPVYRDRLFRASEILGARYVVVHADEYRTVDHYDPKEIEDFAYDDLAPYVEFSAAHGLTVAIENVFEDAPSTAVPIDGKSRFTSRVEELKGLIDRFHTPVVACCWDFGHAHCAFGDRMTEALRVVLPDLVCTHVHDNYYDRDLHLLPFLGDVSWEDQMSLLKKGGYGGKLSFEFVYGRFPDTLLPDALRFAHRAGVYLTDLFDRA